MTPHEFAALYNAKGYPGGEDTLVRAYELINRLRRHPSYVPPTVNPPSINPTMYGRWGSIP
jgi:hypothetical protein